MNGSFFYLLLAHVDSPESKLRVREIANVVFTLGFDGIFLSQLDEFLFCLFARQGIHNHADAVGLLVGVSQEILQLVGVVLAS